jgi:hypothetical protein
LELFEPLADDWLRAIKSFGYLDLAHAFCVTLDEKADISLCQSFDRLSILFGG